MSCDNTCYENIVDKRYQKILWIILAMNAGMFCVEMTFSFLSGSVALLADAVDFFADTANYGISLYVLNKSLATRAKASLFKGSTMGLFGLMVLGNSLYLAVSKDVPQAELMGLIGFIALIVNLASALLLYRYREGDSNRESVWICSRNDAVGNILVIMAAVGVAMVQSHWPDIIVALIITTMFLRSAIQIISSARKELREASEKKL